MALNSFEYATIFQTELDRKLLQGLSSGWMAANAGTLQYNGGKTIKVPKVTMDGLKPYSRTAGFATGAVNLTYETLELTQDRGIEFYIDSMDTNETNFIATVGTMLDEFERTWKVPEIDAYRYSKIYNYANTATHVTTAALTKNTVYEKLRADILSIQDVVGADRELVISISSPIMAMLEQSPDFTRIIRNNEFRAGEIKTTVKFLNDIPIIQVPSSRMKTAYVLNDGGADNYFGKFPTGMQSALVDAFKKAVAIEVEYLYLNGGVTAFLGGAMPDSVKIGDFSYSGGANCQKQG
ncbi:hypothetical protein AGMMS49975_26310 [Clostridia bacterium]|nr:hypothetical protein AGMMS49975_26310 [Clostridia bacterium]